MAVGLSDGFIVTRMAGFWQRRRLLWLALLLVVTAAVFLLVLSILSGCLINTRLMDFNGDRQSDAESSADVLMYKNTINECVYFLGTTSVNPTLN